MEDVDASARPVHLVVLGGRVGSGKSSLARAAVATWPGTWRRCSQVRPVVVSLLWLDVDARVCRERLAVRQGHPTLRTPAQAHAYVRGADAVCYR